MDKVDKNLLKLTNDQRRSLLKKVERIRNGDTTSLKIKKMKGHQETYRLRDGRVRLVYQQTKRNEIIILYVGLRDSQTYRDF